MIICFHVELKIVSNVLLRLILFYEGKTMSTFEYFFTKKQKTNVVEAYINLRRLVRSKSYIFG
ncbi:MAG: hypothetical protein XD81_0376 [Bacteroidetes bacterium 38_7]|jgi:hypothetical protein|nr:MAG: hypothetical protein XD81_0376 [Bacteroidetes bacterium 38_7]